jgi:hypothetical protein
VKVIGCGRCVCLCVCARVPVPAARKRENLVAVHQGLGRQGLVGSRGDSRPQSPHVPAPAGQCARERREAGGAACSGAGWIMMARSPACRTGASLNIPMAGPLVARGHTCGAARLTSLSDCLDTAGHFCTQGGVDLKQAPGWGSLLPSTKLGVDAGLQCPMCGGSGTFQPHDGVVGQHHKEM